MLQHESLHFLSTRIHSSPVAWGLPEPSLILSVLISNPRKLSSTNVSSASSPLMAGPRWSVSSEPRSSSRMLVSRTEATLRPALLTAHTRTKSHSHQISLSAFPFTKESCSMTHILTIALACPPYASYSRTMMCLASVLAAEKSSASARLTVSATTLDACSTVTRELIVVVPRMRVIEGEVGTYRTTCRRRNRFSHQSS